MASACPDIAAASAGAQLARGRSYVRRQPEHSLVHQLVLAEADGLRQAVYAASDFGRGLPRHVDKELDAFLDCGLLHRGFARVVCLRCRTEHLVAFSCKGRGICPSCTSRRMADTAAHLVDRVLPWAPYRQWVVTFSPRVRYHLAADPKLASLALSESLRAIFNWQKKQARTRGERPGRANSTAAVTFIQRFNSALELSLHCHILILDGVFIRDGNDPDARPRFVELGAPTDEDVAKLLDAIVWRVTAMLQKKGRLDDGDDEPPEPHLQMAMRKTRGPRRGPAAPEPLPRLCARREGFSLHAGTAIHKNDRIGLERLCRYGLRPPLAQGRLSRAADGTIAYQMKRRYSDGREVLQFEPREFLLRLCALVPPRRFQMIRYAGLFAPHARGRYAITGRGMHDKKEPAATPKVKAIAAQAPAPVPAPVPAPAPAPAPAKRDRDGPDDPSRARRLSWATLMKRSFGIDVLRCPTCDARMELVATIEDAAVARKILEHLGLPTRGPPRPAPWVRQPALPHVEPETFEGVDPPSMCE